WWWVGAGDGGDDRRVRARMQQGYPGLEADDGEVGPVHSAVAHAAAPFDGETEGQPGLGEERRAGTPGLARSDAVHRAERPGERLAGAVAVARRDVQQRFLVREHLGPRDGEPAAPYV